METPRRNLKNEILAALAAIIMLGIAVGLAVLLTRDSLQDALQTPAATGAAVAEATTAPPDTATPLPTLTATRVPPSATPQPEASDTPHATATEKATAAPAATDAEAGPTVTATRRPSATATTRPTRRPTRTPRPTEAPRSTDTPDPTDAPDLTDTPRSTDKPVETTPTATVVIIAPNTTPEDTPTASPTVLLATPITPPPTDLSCVVPAGWQPYTIQAGDNLFRISLRAGVPLSQMQGANCITDPARIEGGQVVYVPASFFATSAPTGPGGSSGGSTGDTGDAASSIPLQWGCSVPTIGLDAPSPGATLSSPFNVLGMATLEDEQQFNFYKVELRRDGEDLFRNVGQGSVPVYGPNGILTTITPADFGPGTYQLVLTVVDVTGNFPEPCAIRVTFR